MEIQSTIFQFENVFIDISGKSNTVRATRVFDKSVTIPYPLMLTPIHSFDYFQIREGFQIGSILKNPMLIMMGVTLLMTLAIPKMMGNLDPEALQELQNGANSQQNQPEEQNPVWIPPSIES